MEALAPNTVEKHASLDRMRLGKMLALVGSDKAGERAAALQAIDQALARAEESWRSIGEMVAGADMRGLIELFERLVAERLQAGLAHAWSMDGPDAKLVRGVLANIGGATPVEVACAVKISDEAQRRAGAGHRPRGG